VVPVRLLSFTAERSREGARLRWTVGEARDHAGFHVHREEPGRDRVRLTESLVTGGPAYEYLDSDPPGGEAEYWLEEVGRDGSREWHGPVRLQAKPITPVVFAVGRATPNPARGRMTLAYTLPEERVVRATVFDLSGRRVVELVRGAQGPGEHALEWNGETERGGRVAPGLYLLRFEAGSDGVTRKVVFVP
jgi:hypothetical protein